MSASRRSNTGSPSPGGTPVAMTVTPRADGIAVAAQLPQQRLELRNAGRIGTEKRVLIGKRGVHCLERQRADLTQVTVDADVQPGAEVLPGNGAGRDTHDGLACRGSPSAAIIPRAVLLLIRVVGVAGPKAVFDLLVVSRARVSILDEDADRSSGSCVPRKRPRGSAPRRPHGAGSRSETSQYDDDRCRAGDRPRSEAVLEDSHRRCSPRQARGSRRTS